MNWLAKIIEYALLLAVVAAGVWFGAPAIWGHIQSGQQALVTSHAQAGALTADTASSNRQQASCRDEVNHAMDAAKAIAIAAKPAVNVPGQPRPMVTADQIKAAMQ